MNADRARARLVRLRDRIDGAIGAIDEGTAPRDVLRVLREDASGLLGWRDRRGPDRDPPSPASAGERSPEATAALITEHLPELDERIAEVRAEAPELADRMAERIGRRVAHVIDETEGDEALRGLKLEEMRAGAEVFRAARAVRRAPADDPDALAAARTSVEDALNRQYEARLAAARAELDRVRDRLARMERDVARMSERREEEVGRMMRRVLAGPDDRSRGRREPVPPQGRP